MNNITDNNKIPLKQYKVPAILFLKKNEKRN